MGKPTICIGENKGADQLRSNCEADQRLCFRYSDSAIPPLLKSEFSSFSLFSVLVQVGLCRTCSETTLLVFPRGGSYIRLPRKHTLRIKQCALMMRSLLQLQKPVWKLKDAVQISGIEMEHYAKLKDYKAVVLSNILYACVTRTLYKHKYKL